MAQSLWYLRRNGRVLGPFPSPQINEFLNSGDVAPDWEVSLNETDWLTIAESGQFEWADPDRNDQAASGTPAWRLERQKARQRWRGSEDLVDSAIPHDPASGSRIRQAVGRDHLRTDALMQAETRRRVSLAPMLASILVLLIVGVGIWWGQLEQPIQTGIGAPATCAQAAADGVNWAGCDKRGLAQHGLRARNARMTGIRMDNAQVPGADLAYAVLTGASLRNAQLTGAKLMGAELGGADFSGADLAGADLRYAVLKGALLPGTRLDGALLDRATWVDGRICGEGSVGACR